MTDQSNEDVPASSRSEILEALDIFDREYRGRGRWQDWESNQGRKFALKHSGQLYPLNQIISLASGRDVPGSNNIDHASSYIKNYGFEVVALKPSSIRDSFEEVLSDYLQVRQTVPYGKTNEEGKKRRIWSLFEYIKDLFEESSALSQRPHIKLNWSLGQGQWTHVPSIGFLDDRLTTSMHEGYYPVYLFQSNMGGVYLKYGCGFQGLRNQYGRKVGHAIIANRAKSLQLRSVHLENAGFTSEDVTDLREDRADLHLQSTMSL